MHLNHIFLLQFYDVTQLVPLQHPTHSQPTCPFNTRCVPARTLDLLRNARILFCATFIAHETAIKVLGEEPTTTHFGQWVIWPDTQAADCFSRRVAPIHRPQIVLVVGLHRYTGRRLFQLSGCTDTQAADCFSCIGFHRHCHIFFMNQAIHKQNQASSEINLKMFHIVK